MSADVLRVCGGHIAGIPVAAGAGTNGLVQVTADLRGQRGLLHKMVYVHTAGHGIQSLTMKVHIPDSIIEQPRRQDAKVNSEEF
jgi:hypothetical protein